MRKHLPISVQYVIINIEKHKRFEKMTYRRYKIWLIAALAVVFTAAFLFLPSVQAYADEGVKSAPVASVDNVEYDSFEEAVAAWTEGKTLKLLADAETSTIIVEERKTLFLNSYDLKLKDGETGRTLTVKKNGILTLENGNDSPFAGQLGGGGIRVEGTLAMAGNVYIVGNRAEDGGGVYVDNGGVFTLNGGRISGNSASGNGSGVYVCNGAKFTVGGNAGIELNNTSNIYLANGQIFEIAEDFSGQIGVSMAQVGLFTHDQPRGGKIESDDSLYSVIEKENGLALELSPLEGIRAEFDSKVLVFPTTKLDDLKEFVTVSGRNANNVAYPEEIKFTLSGTLTVGRCEITVTAWGVGGETVETTFLVDVYAPKLVSAELSYKQEGTVYFDTKLSALYDIMNFTVTGTYEDGLERTILRTPEETSVNCGEEYITDFFEIASIDLMTHPYGKTEGMIYVKHRSDAADTGLWSGYFTVEITRRQIDLSAMRVVPVYVLERDQTPLDVRKFTPELPQGVTLTIYYLGQILEANTMKPGVYTVQLKFEVDESDHYELYGEPSQGKLIICERVRKGTSNGFTYEVSCEGGISPEWEFSITDTTKDTKVTLSDDLEMKQTFEMTFFPGESGLTPSSFQIRLLLSDYFKEHDFRLFRMKADGSAEEVTFERDGDYLVFEANELLETNFIIAVDSNISLYIALSICFGVLCVIGAGVLLWYFVAKRKLQLND